jgi:hypothetical protein
MYPHIPIPCDELPPAPPPPLYEEEDDEGSDDDDSYYDDTDDDDDDDNTDDKDNDTTMISLNLNIMNLRLPQKGRPPSFYDMLNSAMPPAAPLNCTQLWIPFCEQKFSRRLWQASCTPLIGTTNP